jgi:rfaE bifunctional protein nucleotidyltransferase chain/domain
MNTQLKIIQPEQLAERLAELPRPLVFTNGCFDILHRGHTSYLEQARNLGMAMIVAVNSDASVKRQNKGDDRPINSLEDRMAVLASLACIDAVVSFDDDTPLHLIEQIVPDHLVKGGDWLIQDIVGGALVSSNGGQVHSLAFEFERSTTSLIQRIRS